jgi:AcrR family transcriptional regulator
MHSATPPSTPPGSAPGTPTGTPTSQAKDPTPAQSLRERQKLRRKQRIYTVAIGLFREHGFTQTTATDIAKLAHISRGTFFNYYPYKEAVLLDFGALIISQLAALAQAKQQAGLAPLATIEALWAELADITIRERGLIPPLIYELINPDPVRAHTAYETLPLARVFEGPLRELPNLRRDISLERMARTLADAYMMAALRWCSYMRDRDFHDEADKTLRLLLAGMLVPTAPA